MLREYISAAMRQAKYELIDQPGNSYFGEIVACPGVLAVGKTLEECRENLEEALDGWLVLKLQLGAELSAFGGIELA